MSNKRHLSFLTSSLSSVQRHPVLFCSLLYLLYAGLLIFRASFVIDGVRYFSLFDDEMVSMRYANNFAHGFGLVWNPNGPRVEGFTNPLWVFYMVLFHILPIPLAKTSFFIQLTGAVLLLCNGYVTWKLARLLSPNSLLVSSISLLFTLFYFPLNNWGVVLGTEVSVLTVILTATCYLAVRSLQSGKFPRLLYPLLTLGTVTRLDFLIPSLVLFVFLFVTENNQRRKHLIWASVILGGVTVLQTFLRYTYYQEVLPNTYYLKMTGSPLLIRVLRGVYVTVKEWNPVLLGVSILPSLFLKRKEVLLLTAVFLGQVAYSMYVGGDAWEQFGGSNRYTAIVTPLLFILFGLSVKTLATWVSEKARRTYSVGRLGLLLLVISFISFNTVSDNAPFQMLLLKGAIVIHENKSSVEGALRLQKRTKEKAKIAVTWAGTLPYFTEREFLDLLGKNDRKIAHENARQICNDGVLRNLVCFWPGHMKWDTAYSIGQLKPDVVVQYMAADAIPYLEKDYIKDSQLGMYVRKETTQVKQ